MKKNLFLFLFLLFLSAEILAQVNLDTKVSVDTLSTNDKFIKIVIYNDKTWDSLKLPSPKYMSSDVYADYWKTNQRTAYEGIELTDIPDTMVIRLIEDSSDFCIPVKGEVYSRYGIRHGRPHTGVDIPLNKGDSIFAAFEGKVRYTDYCGGYGNMIVVRHPNGLETYYAHLSRILVNPDEFVNAGELIGLGGSTGRSTGPHLHFEIRYKDFVFDPERAVSWSENKLRADTLQLYKRNFSPYSRYSNGSDNSIVSANGQVWHSIRQGDTLGAIARKYGTSVNRICSLNRNLTPETILQLGRKIRVN